MITTLAIGPLKEPLNADQQRAFTRFLVTAMDREGELWIVEDHAQGTISATAKLPCPVDLRVGVAE